MFPRLAYIEWIREQLGTVRYDFGSSDLAPESEGAVPERLTSLPEPDDDVRLEAQIADAYGPSTDPANVLVTAGATGANVVAAATALGEWGEGVLVESPGYEPLEATPRGLGGATGRVRREPPRYRLDPAAVADAADETTGLVTVTNRHNPSGRLASRETLDDVATAAASHGAVLLVDEVYAPFTASPRSGPGTAFGGVTAAGLDRTLVSGSLTKFFGFDALRTGWLVGPVEVVDRARAVEPHFLGASEVGRHFARRVFANLATVAERSRDVLARNHASLASFVESRDDLDGVVFPGSTFAFLSHRSATGEEVTRAALDAGVLVSPGRFFDRPGRFRVALGGDPDRMQAGLDAFGSALDSLPAGPGDPA